MLLASLLTFVFLNLSASTSSCETGANTYLNSSGMDYKTMAWNDAIAAGIPAQLFVNQINQESGFNPSAYSSEGAQGIAQIMPKTAQSWQVNAWNPEEALRVAANHMHWYYQHYGYDYAKALACYNGGCARLEWAIQNCLNFYWCLYPETRHYIDVIMG